MAIGNIYKNIVKNRTKLVGKELKCPILTYGNPSNRPSVETEKILFK